MIVCVGLRYSPLYTDPGNVFKLCSENTLVFLKNAFIFINPLSGRLISLEDAALLSCLFVSRPILRFHAQQATLGFHHC